jgi:hypothetical protein
MSHRAAVYTVRVRRKWDRSESKECRRLGDIDEQGTYLGDVFERYCADPDFQSVSADGTKVVRCVDCSMASEELLLTTQHGQNGLAADIVNASGQLRLRQTPDDTQLLKCGALFRLPRADDMGWLAVHVAHGRGVKGLLEKGLLERFREEFDGLKLEIVPFVHESTLKAAVDSNQIDKVKLVKYEQPNDRAVAATNKWVPAGVVGRLELDITARGTRVIGELVRRFLSGDASVFHSIVEFEGITFDQAKVEVVVDGDVKRTFNIEKPDAGHAFTEDMEGLTMDNDEPTMDSVFAALRSALTNVSA